MGVQGVPLIAVTTAVIAGDPPRDGARRTYAEAIFASGAVPLLMPNLTPVAETLAHCQGLLLTGGGDLDPRPWGWADEGTDWATVDPDRDQTELEATRWAIAQGLPIFAICRGMQVLAVAAGGSLLQDIGRALPQAGVIHQQAEPRQVATHAVQVAPTSHFHALVGGGGNLVNSFHHQAVQSVAWPWRAVAWSADGLIEAIERATGAWQVGVQWHPEDMHASDAWSQRLFREFGQAARAYQERTS